MRHFALALETGVATGDDGALVHWAACPDLPGAYAEAPDQPRAVAELRSLCVEILAEHLVRGDPLETGVGERAGVTRRGAELLVTVTPADEAAARETPLLEIEAPEP